jgi:uncharacterized protein YecE (DUF72 family)
MTSRIHIGTSGWNYKHWLGPFYPERFPAQDMLEFYARHFDTVELNNSFYHLPTANSFEKWRDITPQDFVFAVKASRFTTHMKKLKEPTSSTDKFFAAAEKLEEKLGVILFQLPPRWKVNLERLSEFLQAMPREYRYAFEFREESWFTSEVYDLLKKHSVALCVYHMKGWNSPIEVTADFVYVRMHGTETQYGGSYSLKMLEEWASQIRQWQSESKDVYVYFNNDPEAQAIRNALTLKEMMAT